MLKPLSLLPVIILAAILSLLPLSLQGQDVSPRFHHIKDLGGKDPVIWSVFQSQDGFIWFGSEKGLFRYDGYEIRQIPLELADNTASLQFSVATMMEYPVGTLWLASANNGLIRYNMHTASMQLFQHIEGDSSSLNDNFITSMILDANHLIWLATTQGLQVLDPEKGHITHIHSDPEDPESLPEGAIRRLFVDSRGQLWLGHVNYGLSKLKAFKDGKASFYNFPHDPNDPRSFPAPYVMSLEENPQGQLWAGLSAGGIVRFSVDMSVENPDFQWINTREDDPTAFTSSTANWIEKGPNGQTWIATQNRLHYYDETQKRFYNFSHDPDDPFSLGINRQRHLYLDQDQNLWITMWGGIDLVSPFMHPLRTIKYEEVVSENAPISGSPFAILKDSYGNLWIGTNKQGIMMIHGATGKAYYYKPGDAASGWKAPDVLDIIEDKDHRLWIATSWGLARLDLAAQDFKDFKPQFHFYPFKDHSNLRDTTNGPPIRVLYDLEPDGEKGIWIATHLGLSYFDKKTERFSNMTDLTRGYVKQAGNFYYAVKQDQAGNLWLGTKQTGVKLLPAGQPYDYRSLIHIRSLAKEKHTLISDFVYALELDEQQRLWVGTGAGLCVLDSFRITEKDTFFHFSAIHPDENWTCNNLLKDAKGRLWYNTGEGIAFLHPDGTPGFSLDKGDGFVSVGSNLGSHFQGRDGEIYWGTSIGISVFHPDSLKPNPHPPRVRLTRFQLFNREVLPGGMKEDEDAFYLEKDISALEELRLKHHQSVLTFEYAALNYYQSAKNEYAYMMEGFDKDWVYAGKRRSATYTNLDPGTYHFRVKACNNDGVWNEEGTSLRIIIDPPWYQTWWAFIIYGTLITSLFGLYLYYRVRKVAREYETQARIERAKTEERESVRKRSSRDFHDEAGNKLTKLSLYTELTKRKLAGDPEAMTFLGHIENNVRELATGMRDFIWVLDPEKDTLVDTLNRLKDFGSQLFEHSTLRFKYEIPTEELEDIPLEIKAKRHLLLIFKEAMNNSLKYAEARKAFLKVEREADHLRIIFEDDGVGFDIENGKQGNGLGNMDARAREIGGRLTLNTRPGDGTRLIFEMPIEPEN